MLVLLIVIYLSFRDGEYGLPALLGTAVAIILGPLTFYYSSKRARDRQPENELAVMLRSEATKGS